MLGSQCSTLLLRQVQAIKLVGSMHTERIQFIETLEEKHQGSDLQLKVRHQFLAHRQYVALLASAYSECLHPYDKQSLLFAAAETMGSVDASFPAVVRTR